MVRSYLPDAGDIVWVQLPPQAGQDRPNRRSAVVLSPRAYNAKAGLLICVPVTNQLKGYPFEVALNGAGPRGAALADQVRSLDWHAHPVERKGHASADELKRIRALVKSLLSIPLQP